MQVQLVPEVSSLLELHDYEELVFVLEASHHVDDESEFTRYFELS